MRIDQPGLYNLTMDDYLGDCCAGPSMRSGDAVTIMTKCPAKAWHESYMNPDREEKNKTAFDIGTAAHLASLEPERFERDVVIIEAETYQTKAAQAARDAAYFDGKVPLLEKHYADVCNMRDALLMHPVARALLSGEGENEITAVAKCPRTGLWMKARPDRRTIWRGEPLEITGSTHEGRSKIVIEPGDAIAVDLKSTTDASEDKFQRRLGDLSYYQQAAWYDETLALLGKDIKHFIFITQETKAPYLPQLFLIDPHAVKWGYLQNRAARVRWAQCLADNDWPGYGDGIRLLTLPTYLEYKLEEKLERAKDEGRFEDFVPPPNDPDDDPLEDLISGRRRFEFGG